VRDPLVVGITDLRKRPGTQRHVEIDAELPGLQLSSAAVPPDEPVHVDVMLESLTDGLTATGTIRAPWVGECRRCLDPVRGVVEARLREVYDPHPIEGETYPFEGDRVDLEPMVRDVVLLALPLAPLCRDDCPGPAPETFPTVVAADDAGDEAAPATDPRWAALDELRFE
jgi:uncharacterized protein